MYGILSSSLALAEFGEDVLAGHDPETDFYRVVAGQDKDGDGRIDAVSILE